MRLRSFCNQNLVVGFATAPAHAAVATSADSDAFFTQAPRVACLVEANVKQQAAQTVFQQSDRNGIENYGWQLTSSRHPETFRTASDAVGSLEACPKHSCDTRGLFWTFTVENISATLPSPRWLLELSAG